MSQNNILKSKTSQNNLHFKIMNKLVTSCHITKIVVTNYSYKLNVKIMVDDYDFKTLVINYGMQEIQFRCGYLLDITWAY